MLIVRYKSNKINVYFQCSSYIQTITIRKYLFFLKKKNDLWQHPRSFIENLFFEELKRLAMDIMIGRYIIGSLQIYH